MTKASNKVLIECIRKLFQNHVIDEEERDRLVEIVDYR